jgi:GLPGLI family protein
MKTSIFLIHLLLIQSQAFSQVLDSAFLKVSYTFYYRPDSTNLSLKKDDLLILEIGNKISKCYSFYHYLRDSMLSGKYSEQQVQGATRFSIDLNGFSKNGTSAKVFRDNSTRIIKITDQLFLNSYFFIDSVSDMKWALVNDTMTIMGYPCFKATTKYRGRNYTAWYTTEIPMSYGPLKFGGLPGLIINLSEAKGDFQFECRTIELIKNKTPIVFERKKYQKITREEHRKLIHLMYENPDAFAASMGLTFQTIHSDVQPGPRKVVFNPMELE